MIEFTTFCIAFGGFFSENTKEVIFHFLSEKKNNPPEIQKRTLNLCFLLLSFLNKLNTTKWTDTK